MNQELLDFANTVYTALRGANFADPLFLARYLEEAVDALSEPAETRQAAVNAAVRRLQREFAE